MKSRKKPILITVICLAAAAVIAAGVWFFWLRDYLTAVNSPPVYVTSVSSIIGMNSGSNPRYSGVVEPQQTYKINRDESKPLGEILIAKGDVIHKGDVLFRYNTDDLQLSLREAENTLQGLSNQIASLKAQITELEAEKKKLGKDDQYAYTVRIQGLELQVEQLEYQKTLQNTTIDRLRQDLENTDVISEVEGTVKEINETPGTDSNGQPKAFISILSSEEFRIRGTVTELNMDALYEGLQVVVHSRVDPEATWEGVVNTIEREPTGDQNNNNFYYGYDSGESSSKYNFYVTLGDPSGLILGQHVYIEPDTGAAARKEGLWLPAVYVAHDATGSFVWAKDAGGRLEKRIVILGEYDSENDLYQIRSGISKSDSIAYPSDSLMVGMPTTTDASVQQPLPGDVGGAGGENVFFPDTGADTGANGYFVDGGENGLDEGDVYGGSLGGDFGVDENAGYDAEQPQDGSEGAAADPGSAENAENSGTGGSNDVPVDIAGNDGVNDRNPEAEPLSDPGNGGASATSMDDYYYDEVNNTFVYIGSSSQNWGG